MSIAIVTPETMRLADARTIRKIGLPGMVLMENAARALVDVVLAEWPEAGRFAVVCGGGNNGGDGLAAARILHGLGHEVDVRLVADPDRLRGDAARQLAIATKCGVPVRRVSTARDLAGLGASDVVVDALLGTGLDRAAEGLFRDAIAATNRARRPVLAVDIPSGLDGATGTPPGEHVRATVTVTFAAAKWAHVLAPARESCGRVVVADIGITAETLEHVARPARAPFARVFDDEALALVVAPRAKGAHKGDFGHLLLLAGGRGQAGAAILAARGALRSGVGLLTIAAPAGIVPILQGAVPEAMAVPLPEAEDGRPSPSSASVVAAALAGKTAVAAGPGLGTTAGAAAALGAILRFEGPRVLDADALNLLASGRVKPAGMSRGLTVLTPHPGEAARLLGSAGSRDVQADRPRAVLDLARRWKSVALLKGDGTLVADRSGALAFVASGTPAMATGGSGDVLCGVVGSFLARGIEPFEAAGAAAHLHGVAGERSAEKRGEEGTAAGDLPDAVAEALRQRGR